MSRSSPFKHHRFPRDIILRALCWYLRYPLSYQGVVDLLAERGVKVDRCTVYRWVQKFSPELTTRAEKHLRRPASIGMWTKPTFAAAESGAIYGGLSMCAVRWSTSA